MASRDLSELDSLKIFEQIGTKGKGIEYFLSGAAGEKGDII
jgi:ATP-dependent DNA helicase RecG